MMVVLCSACSSDKKTGRGYELTTTQQSDEADEKYSEVEAVVLKTDTENKKITLQEVHSQSRFELSYSGGTYIISEYDKQMTMAQVEEGEIVDIRYNPETLKLYEMNVSKDAWEYIDVENLVIDKEAQRMSVGSSQYKYDANLVVVSNRRTITLLELNEVDVLTVRGIDNKICSVVVTRGHGYVRLEKAAYFVDGLIEIGTKIMLPVAEDMLIVAPEGECKITVTKDGKGGSGDYTIKRDQETTVNVSEFQEEAQRKGAVRIEVEPAEAEVYIDNSQVDYSDYVTLTYGKHKVTVVAEGYQTIEEDIVVDAMYVSKKFVLLEDDEEAESDDSSDDNTDSDSDTDSDEDTDDDTNSEGADSDSDNSDDESQDDSEETVTDEDCEITIEGPKGVSVYFDGTYKGVAPVSFTKVTGKHTITLSLGGTSNVAYAVEIEDDGQDVALSFPDLSTVSG